MYKKFFVGIIAIAFIVSIIQIFLAYSLSNKNIWKDAVPANIITKHRNIVKNINTSKILIVGGSSTFFGVKTELMSRCLNYPVINLGSGVGLNLDYIFYDAKKSINNDDIVILPIEYELYYLNDLDEVRNVQIWQNDKPYFEKLLFRDKIKLLWSISFDLNMKVIGTYMGVPVKEENRLEYLNVNENGDSINTLETLDIRIKEPFNKKKIYLNDETEKIIIDFLNYCKEKNVKVFVTYPPYYYKQEYFDGYNLEQINKINQFWKEQNVTILGQYTDFIYTDKNDFYDSQYHLNIKGREKRTEQLIKLLKPYINNN